MSQTRVVITGLGAVTSVGLTVSEMWNNLIQGNSGVGLITQFDPSPMPCHIAGEVKGFLPEEYMDRKEARRTPRAGQVALAAAIQAVRDAGLPDTMPDPERAGVMFGTTVGGLDRMSEGLPILHTQGYTKINPFWLPSALSNFPAYLISKQFQCLGPNSTISTACATGTQVVAEGAEFIRRGVADVVITGGTEASITDYALGGFCAMRALPVNYNDNPAAACRPFDARREGFIFSEGSGVMVLESLEHAKQRGARIYAEIAGYASSADGFNMAFPDPEGKGAVRAMRWAIAHAGLKPEQVDYINAHGTSTLVNDEIETRAIKTVFGEYAYRVAISSTKSMTGHAMGASGTIEAIACVLVIQDCIIPPTINYEYPDPACDLDYVPNTARRQDVKVALSNSFGLGGQNACLVLKKYEEEPA